MDLYDELGGVESVRGSNVDAEMGTKVFKWANGLGKGNIVGGWIVLVCSVLGLFFT